MNEEASSDAALGETAPPRCPFCCSSEVVFKARAGLWECMSCEQRFAGAAASPAPIHRLGDKAIRPKHIFFSYGHDRNKELVLMLKAALEKRGHTVWFDAKDIGTWDDWKGRITRGIDSSEMAIAFMSSHALRDPGVCRNEIAISLNRFGSIYPVMVDPDIYDDIPITIRHLQWPDLSRWQDIRDGKFPEEDWSRWYEGHLVDLIEKIEGEATHFASESQVLREVLRPLSFEAKLAQHVPGFVGRDWVFKAYEHWLNEQPQSRLFWLKAGPGVGKTAIAANLVSRMRGSVVSGWFCDAKSTELKDPRNAIFSLAFQLALRWEDYRVRLLRQLNINANTPSKNLYTVRNEFDKKSVQDLFRHLIVEPLANLIWREHKLVVVIDALDEATDDTGHNSLTEFICTELGSLPEWIGFVITSRPDPTVVAYLQGFKPFEIDAQDTRNVDDLRQWYGLNLGKVPQLAILSQADQRAIEQKLIDYSEGMILYLKMIAEGFREGSFEVSNLGSLQAGVPGLFSRYYGSFLRRFGDGYAGNVDVRSLLRLLLTAGGPLPEDLACEVLKWNAEQFQSARFDLASYVVERPEGFELFHKTMNDWLASSSSKKFHLDAALAKQDLANAIIRSLDAKDIASYATLPTLIARTSIRWSSHITWLPKWLPDIDQWRDWKSLGDVCLACFVLAHDDHSILQALMRQAMWLRVRELKPDLCESELGQVADFGPDAYTSSVEILQTRVKALIDIVGPVRIARFDVARLASSLFEAGDRDAALRYALLAKKICYDWNVDGDSVDLGMDKLISAIEIASG